MSNAHPQQHAAPLFWAAVVALGLYFVVSSFLRPLVRPYAYSDFATFYSAAQAFAAGESPYELTQLQDTGRPHFEGWIGRYFYPPPFAACVVRPFLLLPFEVARRVWVVIEATAYIAALVLLAELVYARRDAGTVTRVMALGLPFAPFGLDLKLGSVSGLLLLLLVVFQREWEREHRTRAALVLGASILLKLSPILVAVVFLLRGKRRFCVETLCAALGCVVVALPWTGLTVYLDYARQVVPILMRGNFSWFTNQSIDAFFWRLFMTNPDTSPWIDSPILYRSLTLGCSALVLLSLFVAIGRARRTPRADLWLTATTLVASLLLARISWECMLVLALPCFALWLHDLEDGRIGRARATLLGLAFALCAAPIPYSEEPLRAGFGILLEAPRTAGLLILWVLTAHELMRPGALDPSSRSHS